MSPILGYLNDYVNYHFASEQSMKLQNCAWLKDPFQMLDRPVDFNVTELINMVLNF